MRLLLLGSFFILPVIGYGQATFTPLGDLKGKGFNSLATGVSADGRVVVGNSRSDLGSEAFRWEDGVMTGLGSVPGGFFAKIAWATSGDGSVVVGAAENQDDDDEAFRWENGVLEGIGDLPGGGFRSEAFDVSNDGFVVVGSGNPGVGNPPFLGAFRWEDGVMEALPDLPGGEEGSIAYAVSDDGNIVVGRGLGPSGTEAARWVDGVVEGLGFPPGGSTTVGYDASADATVVVGHAKVTNPNGTVAVVWREGDGMNYLPDLPGGSPYMEAFGVSGDGRVIVGPADGPNGFEIFIWTEELGTTSFRELLEALGVDLTGWSLGTVHPNSVSHDGRVIVGTGTNPDGDQEGWRVGLPPFPVPNAPEAPETTQIEVSVYPNPVRERATVRLMLAASSRSRVTVSDVLGRVVAVLHDGLLDVGAHSFSLSTERLPSGVYVVQAGTASGHSVGQTITVLR